MSKTDIVSIKYACLGKKVTMVMVFKSYLEKEKGTSASLLYSSGIYIICHVKIQKNAQLKQK